MDLQGYLKSEIKALKSTVAEIMTGPGTYKNFTFTAAGTFSVTQMPQDIPGNLGKFWESLGNSGKTWEIPGNSRARSASSLYNSFK